jgi:cysteinyl-tRNA synthetase
MRSRDPKPSRDRFDRLRRFLVTGTLATAFAGLSKTARSENGAGTERSALLRAVRRWGCQYQRIDIDAIAASPLDLVVLEPSLDDASLRFIAPAEIDRLKRKPDGSRRLVIGYLPVGEGDIKRWYISDEMRRRPPSFFGPENPDWPGARHVRYWDPAWRELVATGPSSLLARIVEAGFDGALLDRVDAYGDWTKERPSAQEDMIDLVETIRQVARRLVPDFLLVPQNAEQLLLSPRYVGLIDGLNKESLLTGLSGPNLPNSDDDIAWSLDRLRLAQEGGVKLLATEYVTDPALRPRLARKLEDLGFTPFFGKRDLDALP